MVYSQDKYGFVSVVDSEGKILFDRDAGTVAPGWSDKSEIKSYVYLDLDESTGSERIVKQKVQEEVEEEVVEEEAVEEVVEV